MRLNLFLAVLAIIVLSGCGPNAERILKKYEPYGAVEPTANKAGFSIPDVKEGDGGSTFSLIVKYSNPLLNHVDEYVQVLEKRLVVANAQNPSEILPVQITLSVDSLNHDEYELPAYHTILSVNKKDVKSGFILIGFKGIGGDESEEMETPAMFYILELTGGNAQIINTQPLMGNQIFAADYQATHFTADAVRIQQIIGSWVKTGGGFKTDPNNVYSFNGTYTVDSAYLNKPSITFGKEGAFTSSIDYSDDDFVDLFKYAKSLRIGQNTTWLCDKFVTGNNDFIFSCDLKLTPVCAAFDYKLTLVGKNLLRLDVFENIYKPEAPDPNTGYIFKGGNVPLHSTFNFKRL